ncbi:DNA-binding protein [Xanthomonas arboricola]|uniref:YobI family P-loop NTPase n=1 Tax=Xanthomonas arboricola TaxID=56448 RepID=UPI0011B0728D|nr:DNA-binding protein [Xanthomonas arboricola]
MFSFLRKKKPENGPLLNPLTPHFIEAEHGLYVEKLNAALANPDIHNIALSGSYGVGKSSILKRVAEIHKKAVLELSLSTLAPIEQPEGEDGLPKQATTPTNTIQQEIVKQLLYRETPSRTPGSRFKRIERFHWLREALLALLVGTVLTTAFILTGWTTKIVVALPGLHLSAPWSHVAVLCVGTLVSLLLRHTFYGRLNIKEFKAGAATVTLDSKSVSYFDQYLDEIVYFFEVSKKKIVVFEDIDRFNDSHIFETLRSLNTLLNGSPQIKGRICFIYAIKDSIFDRMSIAQDKRIFNHDLQAGDDPAQVEIVRANRTKFFDLVIPVVPFITHQSARNLTAQLLQGLTHSIDLDLVDLASRYVPDMRLLKNVRNEFLIFREKILTPGVVGLKLSETELFAMMLYKNTHLSDFEAIRIGKSSLDQLYLKSRGAVTANIRRLENEVLQLRRSARLDLAVASRSAELGEQLRAHLMLAVKALGKDYNRAALVLNGENLAHDDLLTTKFWKTFIEADGAPALIVDLPRSYQEQLTRLTFSRSDLQGVLGTFDTVAWREVDRNKNLKSQEELRDLMRFMKSADIHHLMARDELTVDGKVEGEGLDQAAKGIFREGLAYQLLKSGYINRNFTLYTATFHGDRVSSAATNYIIHHVDRDKRDEDFALAGDDVEAIIRERRSLFGEPALYNIDILNHLLASKAHDRVAGTVISSLAKLGKEQKSFIGNYLRRGTKRSDLVERITPIAPSILAYLASEAELELSDRLILFNSALSKLSSEVKYVTGEELSAFLSENYGKLKLLSSDQTTDEQLELAASLFEQLGIELSSLRSLGAEARKIFINRYLYQVTTENLQIAVGDQGSLALDLIEQVNGAVYSHAINHLSAYLSSVEGISHSVAEGQNFAQVLVGSASADRTLLEKLIRMAAEDCALDDISDVPSGMWALLATECRFKASLHNVHLYLQEYGEVDGSLVEVLRESDVVTDVGERGDAQENKKTVAFAALQARDLLSATARAKICASLSLEYYIDPTAIEPEEGALFAELLRRNVINDTIESYLRVSKMSWTTKEDLITSSKKFAEFMTPAAIGHDLEALLSSKSVSGAIKDAIVANALAYADASDTGGLKQLGNYAAEQGMKLDYGLIERLAEAGGDSSTTLVLLGAVLSELTEPQVSSILRVLGGDYAALTAVGKDRPKVPNTPPVVLLLDFLITNGAVNTYVKEKGYLRVNKKHK